MASGGIFELAREVDEPSAGGEHGQTGVDGGAQRFGQAEGPREAVNDGGFAAGKNKAVEALKVRHLAHSANVRAKRFENLDVLFDPALEGKHSNAHGITSRAQRGGAGPGHRRR